MLQFLSMYPKIIIVQKNHIPHQFDLFLAMYRINNKVPWVILQVLKETELC